MQALIASLVGRVRRQLCNRILHRGWIRSYVIAEEGGTLGTVCIYQASDTEAVRRHALRVGMPADEIIDVADTVVIRPDPVQEPAAS